MSILKFQKYRKRTWLLLNMIKVLQELSLQFNGCIALDMNVNLKSLSYEINV